MRYAALLLTLASLSTACAADTFVMSLDGDKTGELPHGWTTAKTGTGSGSVWKVVADTDGKKVLAQTSDQGPNRMFNLCVADSTSFTNVDMSVKFKAVAGKLDQGGGLVWRYRDAGNYYIARMNPLEDNFRLYKVVAGKRIQLATADVKAAAGNWHTLRIIQRGDHIECYFNGKKCLDAKDDTFKAAGKIGVWSKADAQTYFSDLRASELLADTRKALSTAQAQVGLFEQAVRTYEATVGTCPTTAEGLQALLVCPPGIPAVKWAGPYLLRTNPPLDPWGKPYQYRSPGIHNPDSFDVWTVGPDGKPIGNW